uniref:Integrase catalytic domain-containing protein n=1 Tax=Cannabis sativa TaxID=3483 RepID=A0A803P4I4_CANSA
MSSHSQTPQVTNTGAAGAATPTIPAVQPNYTQPFSTLNQPFPLKLDRKNYVLSKTMVSTIIRGHRLNGFVNGTRPYPAEFIPTAQQYKESQALELLSIQKVMGCDSSAALWKALENLYGADSKLKMDDTQTLIQTTRKGILLAFDSKMERLQNLSLNTNNKSANSSVTPNANLANHSNTGVVEEITLMVVEIKVEEVVVAVQMDPYPLARFVGAMVTPQLSITTDTMRCTWDLTPSASNDVTANENNMVKKNEYGGKEKLIIGDASKVLELIHTDLWGPALIASNTNFKYYIHFVDNFSRYTWLYPLKQKSDALNAFIDFKAFAENQFETKIKSIKCDWGGEYHDFESLVRTNGILFQHSCPHTSAQNGSAERKHRHIVEMGLTLLAQASMPLKF